MRDSVLSMRYSSVCNVLCLWSISLIPTYRVYRLYDIRLHQIQFLEMYYLKIYGHTYKHCYVHTYMACFTYAIKAVAIKAFLDRTLLCISGCNCRHVSTKGDYSASIQNQASVPT